MENPPSHTHTLPSTQALTCPAGSRGPGGPGLKLGGVMGWGCPNLLPTLPSLSLGNRRPGCQSAPQPRPSLCLGLRTAPLLQGAPEHAFPNSYKQHNRTALFWGHFCLGAQGVGPHRGASSLRALAAAQLGTPRSPPPAKYLPPLFLCLFFFLTVIKPSVGWFTLDPILHHPFFVVPPPSFPSETPLPPAAA